MLQERQKLSRLQINAFPMKTTAHSNINLTHFSTEFNSVQTLCYFGLSITVLRWTFTAFIRVLTNWSSKFKIPYSEIYQLLVNSNRIFITISSDVWSRSILKWKECNYLFIYFSTTRCLIIDYKGCWLITNSLNVKYEYQFIEPSFYSCLFEEFFLLYFNSCSRKLQPCKVNCNFTQFHYKNSRIVNRMGWIFINYCWLTCKHTCFLYVRISSIANTHRLTHIFLRNNNWRTQSIKFGKLLMIQN